MNRTYDICILGAGLAGVSLAYECSKRGLSVSVVDPFGVAGGASGTPIGLVNPATGRYATLGWRSKECYEAVLQNLERVQKGSSVQFFKRSGVLRPALDEKIASRMKENFDSTEWPEDWCEWLDERTVKELHNGIKCTGGGVWLPIGLTVDIGTYLKCFAEELQSLGTKFNTGQKYELSKSRDKWVVSFEDGKTVEADKVITCAGINSSKLAYFKEVPLYPVKGQLAVFKTNQSIPFDHAVSALGYIGSLSSEQFVAGSTYEHKFDHEDPDEEGLEYLTTRLSSVLPELIRSSKVTAQWSGIRASTPNRKPIMGEHPDHNGLFIFAGLGSKGLIFSAYLSQLMTSLIIDGTSLPEEFSLSRFA